MNDEAKDKLQKQWVEDFLKLPKYRGTIEAVPGSGKSMVGKILIEKIKEEHKKLIVVPSEDLKNQWYQDYVNKYNLKNVDVFIINSAIKKDVSNYKFIILDEIHRYGSKKFRDIFTMIKPHVPILGLTGTFKRTDEGHKFTDLFCPVFATYTHEQALVDGVISEFDIINIPVEFNKEEKELYNQANKAFHYYFSFFNNSFDNVNMVVQKKDYSKINELCSNFNITEQELIKNGVQFYRMMQKRKVILYDSKSKLQAAKKLIQQLNKKIITFSASISSAEWLENNCGGLAYHSKLGKTERMNRIQNFKNSCKLLHSVTALDEGLDVPNIDIAINVSGNSTHRQITQRLGRSTRKSEDKPLAYFINLYIKNTQDEKWTRKRQLKLPNVHTSNIEGVLRIINNA